ncbi:MAG TPA: acetyl/propionyl/methylcrotonyl-CoA carboxylase subunit alpha [Stellaceae bacterium]
MFSKILVANRGEIARRVIRGARRMGIATVAVYSEADANAVHVREADEAVLIGPAPSRDSYLRIDRIVEACRQTGAEAVHPGYGFLSENHTFAEALAAADIVFIGPSPHAIAAMGDKIESKKLARAAGVSGVPGFLDVIPDAEATVRIARDIGYPVMIKASAGGGGKGMRIAHNDDEAREGFRSATAEARSSFGDDRVFLEKYIEEPRHIEIQVLGDAFGHIIHLGERECSIQRRHQKVIEESPSPFLDAATRAAMGAQAVALARAVDYRSAGTVEFIVDKNRKFYFLEMNTRLQVEHPVTELVTGLDLVEWMIRIAAGEKLTIQQSDVVANGWAIEARIYAEDPRRNFLPSIGRLVRYREPSGAGVRVDAGVDEGSEIGINYDPMIAKLAAHGATRAEATARLRDALDAFYIRGPKHNVDFLASVLAKKRFADGRLSTDFIAQEFPDGFAAAAPDKKAADRCIAIAAIVQFIAAARDGSPAADWVVCHGRARHAVTVTREDGVFIVVRDGVRLAVTTDWQPGQSLLHARIGRGREIFQIDRDGIGFIATHGGVALSVKVLIPRAAELLSRMPEKRPPDLSRFLLSPMPGLLVSLAIGEDQPVHAGDELAVVEAMKMMNVLRAERDGRVKTLRAKPGDSLGVDQIILEFA